MAGGSLTITVDAFAKMPSVAQRVLCWTSAANDRAVQVLNSMGDGKFGIRIPEEAFGAGALVLKRGGDDLVSGYVAGTNIVYDAANGQSIAQTPVSCPASTNQPTTTGTPPVVLNVGGNSRAITLNYANAVGAGVVNINWGDGTSTLGAAESGAANHTYRDTGVWQITVTDASDATQVAAFAIKIG